MRLIGGLCALLVAGAAGAAQPVPLKDFARHDEFREAEISPNGDYLAVTMLVEGKQVLGIIDLKTRKVTGQIRLPNWNEVAGFAWVGPNRVVASVATSYGPLDQPALTGELWAIDADGGRVKYLFGYRGSSAIDSWASSSVKGENAMAFVLDPLINDPLSALIRVFRLHHLTDARGVHDPVVERIDVYTGKRERITTLPGWEPAQAAADGDGSLRFAVTADEQGEARLYARATDAWKEIRHPGAAPEEVDLHLATADGSAVFLTSDEGARRECLREYRADTGKLIERLCSETGAVGRPVFSLDRNALIGVRHEDGKPVFDVLDSKHPDAMLLSSLMKAFAGQRVRVTSRTLDGQRLVILVDSDVNPGDFYLVDRQSLKATYLLSRRSWIEPKSMAPSAHITYKTRDGATIHGFLTAREGLATKNGPLVLMPHGGPHGPRDYWEWDSWAQALASRGYSVLQVNFRGSGGYGMAHQTAGYKKWGTLMQDDLTDAVRWAVGEGIADANRVCIMGGSYGGYAALMSVVREPDLYRCAIGLAGVYDLVSQSRDSDIAGSRFGRMYLREVLGDDASQREQSPVTHIARLKAPVLIAHGTADERVPISQARILRRTLEKHGKAYEWAEYKGEQHGFYKEANHEDFLTKTLAFLDKHIGAGAAPGRDVQTQ